MNCNDVKDRINDYVDGNLTESDRVSLSAHLAVCAGCRREEGFLRRLLDSAGGLEREIMPPESLWKGIAERIAPPPGCGAPAARRPLYRRAWAMLPAAAAVLVLAATITVVRPKLAALPEGTGVQAGSERGSDEALAACERARETLLGDYARRKEGLSPEIEASVRGDLLVIDGAVAEVKSALAVDPGNERLRQTLIMVYEKQVGLLARAVRLANSA